MMNKRRNDSISDRDDSVKRASLDGLIASIDFKTDRFDGNYRDAHTYVLFCQDIFDTKRLSYVLDPHFLIAFPEILLQQKEKDKERRKRDSLDHEFRLKMWAEGDEVKEWLRRAKEIESMSFGDDKFEAYKTHSLHKILLLQVHPEPILQMFISSLSYNDDKEIENYYKECKYEKADADSILAVLKSTLGPTITMQLTSTWNDATIPSAQKARATWDFIKQYRTMNTDAVRSHTA
jgi:hypothetical protein